MTVHTPAREFGKKNAGDRLDDAKEFSDVMAALKARDAEIKSFAEKATAEIKDTGKIAAETKSALDKLSEDGAATADRLQALEQRMSRRSFGGEQRKSIGDQFAESDAFKALQNGQSAKARMGIKATITSATTDAAGSAGGAIVPDRRPEIITPMERELRIRDLLLPGRTSSNAVEFLKETGFTNNAAMVAENPGSEKPESDLKFDVVTENVRTIAHMFAASKQVLNDVPMLASYIDTRAIFGLKYVEEEQLLTGDGTGQNLHGLLPQASAFDETTYSGASDTLIDTVRRAILQSRVAEYRPTFVVLNPVDWAAVELTKDTQDRYIWVNVQQGGTPVLWRLAVVETTAMNSGEFLVGSSMGAQIFDAEDAVIEVSDSHKDYFGKNLLAIRAEERLTLAVTRPESYVYGQFDLAASPTING